MSIATVKSRSLLVWSVRRYGQGIYRSVSVEGLKQKGDIATVGAGPSSIATPESRSVGMVRSVDTAKEASAQSRSKVRERRRTYLSGSLVCTSVFSATPSPRTEATVHMDKLKLLTNYYISPTEIYCLPILRYA